MQSLFLAVIPVVMLSGYLVRADVLPHLASYGPELFAAIAAAATLIVGTSRGMPRIRSVYWIFIILIGFHLAAGVIANQAQPGSVIVGGRLYLRAIPLFFLAIVIGASSKNLRVQFLLVTALCLIQLPIAAVQRYKSMAKGWVSGDEVYGTLLSSGVMSIFLISYSTFIVTLYLRKKISLKAALLLAAVVLVPTMINETKITLILIPMAFLIPAFAGHREGRKKQALTATLLSIVFLSVFVPTYDYFIKPKWGYGLLDFITMEGRVEDYLSKGSEVGTEEEVGRIDSIVLPLKTLAGDPVSLILGLGMGSVTHSGLGPQYAGEQYSRYGQVVGPTISRLLWEVGILGVALVLAIMYLIFRDAVKLRQRDDEIGILAQSWIAVVPIVGLCLLYLPLMQAPALSALFWYYSGIIVAASSTPSNHQAAHPASPAQQIAS